MKEPIDAKPLMTLARVLFQPCLRSRISRGEAMNLAIQLAENYEQKYKALEKMCDGLASNLGSFVDYFDAVKNGEYEKRRPKPLSDFEQFIYDSGYKLMDEYTEFQKKHIEGMKNE